jgi:class 3 adenylate cyclase
MTQRRSYEELEALCQELQAQAMRHVVVQQQLNGARDRVDRELSLFRAIRRYIERALTLTDFHEFATHTLESIIDAFEFEVALFLRLEEDGRTLSVVEQFGLDAAPKTLPLSASWLVDDQSAIHGEGSELLSAWSELRLAQAIVCPFHDHERALRGVVVGGVSRAKRDFFEPIGAPVAPSFTVMVHQSGMLWLNHEMTSRVRKHNAELLTLTEAYARFVPFQFLDLLDRDSILQVNTGDHVSHDITVGFIDLRGFSTLAESRGASETFGLLNEYLAAMEPEIAEAGGFINQYFGDGIMALFPKSADCALQAAVRMAAALRDLNARRAARGDVPLRIGAGINSGRVMLGSIGGGKRLDTGVVGDAVNLAARTEGLTKMYAATVVLTDATRSRLADPGAYQLRHLDRVVVKGRVDAIDVYELLDVDEPAARARKLATMPRFDEGRRLYGAGDFTAARRAFEACLIEHPDDGAARLYVERCTDLAARPPAAWSGVTVLTSK